MSICKSKISTKGGEIKEGDKIGMAFTFGKVDYPKYGKIEDCSGIIPLNRPFGEIKICPIVYDKEALEKLAKEMRLEYSYLWEEELDENVERQLIDYSIFTAIMFYPKMDITTKEGKMHVVFVMVGFYIDDFFDEADDAASLGFNSKTVANYMEKIFEGSVDELPNLAPKMVPFLRFLGDWQAANRESFEASKDYLEPLNQERSNLFGLTTIELEIKKRGEEGFSEDTKLDFNGYRSGVLYGLEAMAVQAKIHVPHKVRNDLLFRRLGVCVGTFGGLINAHCGFIKDLENDIVDGSPILEGVVKNGLSLEASFSKSLKHLTNTIQDVRVLGKKLKEIYSDEPEVLRYVDLAIDNIDLQMYCYQHMGRRYGKLDMKVQKM